MSHRADNKKNHESQPTQGQDAQQHKDLAVEQVEELKESTNQDGGVDGGKRSAKNFGIDIDALENIDFAAEAETIKNAKKNHTVHEAQEIETLKQEMQKLKNDFLLQCAENENIRKRHAKEIEDAHKYSVTSFAKELIEVSESLHRAIEMIGNVDSQEDQKIISFVDGIVMTQKILQTVFEKHGIVRVYPVDELFDHNYHQAISKVHNADVADDMVVQVVSAGYKIKDRLLKPAMVVVNQK